MEIRITIRWIATGQEEERAQGWVSDADVYCPQCGQCQVWHEETSCYWEHNAGPCFLCLQCGHSFHYTGPRENAIHEDESRQIRAALAPEGITAALSPTQSINDAMSAIEDIAELTGWPCIDSDQADDNFVMTFKRGGL